MYMYFALIVGGKSYKQLFFIKVYDNSDLAVTQFI